MVQVKSNVKAFKKEKRQNLTQQINEGKISRRTKRIRNVENQEEPEISEKLSKKILLQAEEQRKEFEPVEQKIRINTAEESEDELSENDEVGSDYEPEVNHEDEEILSKFMPSNDGGRNLADIIMSKIEKIRTVELEDGKVKKVSASLDPKVVQVYSKVGLLLSRYKSGKLPKAFKIIPALKNWEEILHLTEPENWTPHATLQATKLFSSNLNGNTAKRFYEYILLDHVRRDIQENKKLNCHLYLALKKAVYKPAGFFKGIIFPLAEQGCTLREALIVGSILVKTSIPVLHSSAALLKLSQMSFSGSNCLFMRYLLDKKYALPYKVVDSLVSYFVSLKNDARLLPVLWHQSLLTFVQRYKQDLTREQKAALLGLVKVQFHAAITPEVQREISDSPSRNEDRMEE